MPEERWVAAPGYEGYYEVSDHGRVRSLDREVTDKRNHKTYALRGKIIKPSRNYHDNEWQIKLNKDGRFKSYKVKILMLLAFVGTKPEGMCALYLDKDKENNVLSNVAWGKRRPAKHVRRGEPRWAEFGLAA